QTAQLAIELFEPTLLGPATGLQRAKENLHHPAHAVVFDHLPNLLDIVDRQAGKQHPLDRHVALRGVWFADQDHVDGHRGQRLPWPPRRTERNAHGPHLDFCLTRDPWLFSTARGASYFRLTASDVDGL